MSLKDWRLWQKLNPVRLDDRGHYPLVTRFAALAIPTAVGWALLSPVVSTSYDYAKPIVLDFTAAAGEAGLRLIDYILPPMPHVPGYAERTRPQCKRLVQE